MISIFNAFTGLAVGFERFVLQNPALMIAGRIDGDGTGLHSGHLRVADPSSR